MKSSTYKMMVPRRGLEPPLLAEHGPEPCASTNSAIWAGAGSLGGQTVSVNALFCAIKKRARAPASVVLNLRMILSEPAVRGHAPSSTSLDATVESALSL